MPDPNDFVQRLRMNSIFPTAGFNPLQAPRRPSFDTGGMLNQIGAMQANARMQDNAEEENRYYRAKGDRLAEIARMAAIQNPKIGISNQWTQKNGQTMDTALGNAPMSDMQKAQIEFQKSKGAQALELQQAKLAQTGQLGERKLDISQQRADTYSSMHNLSDADKLDIINRARAGDIQARGQLQQMIQGDRDTAAMERVETQQKGANQRNTETVTGAGARNKANIDANVERDKARHGFRTEEIQTQGGQARQTNAAKSGKDMLPTQVRVLQANKARQLMNTNPELSDFIEFDEDGNPQITAPGPSGWFGNTKPSQKQYQAMLDTIYGGNTGSQSGPAIMVNGQPMSIDEYNETQQSGPANMAPVNRLPTAQSGNARPVSPSSRYRVTVE